MLLAPTLAEQLVFGRPRSSRSASETLTQFQAGTEFWERVDKAAKGGKNGAGAKARKREEMERVAQARAVLIHGLPCGNLQL